MFWDNLSVPSSKDWKGLKMELMGCPKVGKKLPELAV